MKYLSLFIAVVLFSACAQQSEPENYTEIPWLTLEEAQKQNNKKPRKILVDVYTPWCGPCKLMDKKTFTDPELINYIGKNYYAVKFNGESADPVKFAGKEFANPNFNPNISPKRRNSMHQLTAHLKLRGYPTLFIFDQDLNQISQAVGYKTAPQLLQILQGIEG